LKAAWTGALESFLRFSSGAIEWRMKKHPGWGDPAWRTWKAPEEVLEELYFGEALLEWKALEISGRMEGPFVLPEGGVAAFPLLLPFPSLGSLFIRCGPKRRPEGVRWLQAATLRMLCALPAGRVRLTLFDPVGLGQSFPALMKLADYDETLVGGRIWSDVSHIESALAVLTEHMEKVIQKYLRNRYNSIAEYNREAGELAEPYRLLVIADFPVRFSELAFERLAGILSSGVRCGVFTLILHDKRQNLPPSLDLVQLRRNGLVMVERGETFVADDPLLKGAAVRFEEPPAGEVVNRILEEIGRSFQKAGRVEVPFERVAPKAGQAWSLEATKELRVPLGKIGADRLQYFTLGPGMTQHALVAGKTGSGKSTLFHVMITNLALWYGPQELEFFLVDFKKGVEFKIYAAHRLPHARVIAIESDREFGLSVLRKLDAELARRGRLFRSAGAQDLQGYRRGQPPEPLPRTLLIIDEFQEFFTQDDGIAQEAALLLDRVVRQGRAFGIHVVLGSQTLGGAYTLAKATLGQMAVRIALQCSEADSYLILGDDNPAARLLSRPGEAIYNDLAGRIEGNNPFQVVWLSSEVQAHSLGLCARWLQERGWTPGPQTVFEGHLPADLGQNKALRDLLDQGFTPTGPAARIWLGEPNAIKGPTEVEFGPEVGHHLLIIGQQRDGAAALACSAVLSLMASQAPEDFQVLILDGTDPELGFMERLHALTAGLPFQIRWVEHRRIPEVFEALRERMEGKDEMEGAGVLEGEERAEGGERVQGEDGPDQPGPTPSGAGQGRLFLLVLGLQRFRILRQDEEAAFSPGGNGAPVPSEIFAGILRDGPSRGIHTLVWCDTLNSLNRAMGRRALRAFDRRVLFQMSPADSAELIDSPAANRLGLYNALLFTDQSGGIEKFRPYALPPVEAMEGWRAKLENKVFCASLLPPENGCPGGLGKK
jgi:hypothetical protein